MEDKEKLEYISTTYKVGDMLTSAPHSTPRFGLFTDRELVGLAINVALGLEEFVMTFAFTGSTIALEGVY